MREAMPCHEGIYTLFSLYVTSEAGTKPGDYYPGVPMTSFYYEGGKYSAQKR